MPDVPEPPDRPSGSLRDAVQRWRLVVARSVLQDGRGQREQLDEWSAALASSGLPVAGLDGAPPRPRFMPAAPLGAAMSGEAELVDVWLTERVPAWRVRDALAPAMPRGHTLLDAYDVWLGAPALAGQVVASTYRAALAGMGLAPDAVERACRGMLESATLPRERRKGQGAVAYDLRPFIESLAVAPDQLGVRMTLRHDAERGIGRPEEVLAEIGARLGTDLAGVAIVREGIVLAPPPPPAPPRQRARPRQRQDSASRSLSRK